MHSCPKRQKISSYLRFHPTRMVVFTERGPFWAKDCTTELETTAGVSSQSRADGTTTPPELNAVQESDAALRRLDSADVCETTA